MIMCLYLDGILFKGFLTNLYLNAIDPFLYLFIFIFFNLQTLLRYLFIFWRIIDFLYHIYQLKFFT